MCRQMLTIITFMIFLTGMTSLIPWAESASSSDPKIAVATVMVRRGQVEVMRYGQTAWSKAAKGMLIFEGDRIRTRELSRAAILLQDGSVTKLSANTDLSIPIKTEKNRIKLLLGRIWAKITKQPSDLEIETPSAVAAIKGTELELSVSETGNVELTVWDGLIRFFNAQGEVLVHAAQRSNSLAGGNQAPSTPLTVDLKTLEHWFDSVQELPTDKNLKVKVRNRNGQEETINLHYRKE